MCRGDRPDAAAQGSVRPKNVLLADELVEGLWTDLGSKGFRALLLGLCEEIWFHHWSYGLNEDGERTSNRSVCLLRSIFGVQRVEIADHLVQAGGVEMRVNLGGLDARMPQKLLQHAQVCTA